jgi:D-threo-aldose 1-dehydrogenase
VDGAANGGVVTIELGALGLGAANLGNLYRAMDDETSTSIVDTAWRDGVRYFDTAPHYGLGLSEERLGRALSSRPRDNYVISTKVGRLLVDSPATASGSDLSSGFAVSASRRRQWDFSEAGIRRSLEQSLDRLGLQHIDVLYLHDPEEFDLGDALGSGLPALEKLRDEGLVTSIGIGSKSVEALELAVELGNLDLVMIAGRYTLLDQSAARRLLPLCDVRGVTAVAVAVYNSGILAQTAPTITSHYEYGRVSEQIFEQAVRLSQECNEFGVTLPAVAMQFPLRNPQVSCVVMGASSPAQAQQNVARMRTPIPEELWMRLEQTGYGIR